jgi:hypothetical protein
MPNREDLLYEKTYRGQVDELEKRIYYTLTSEERLQAHRVAKALALVIKLLHDKNVLTDNQIDDLLLEAIF